jgi:DNA polymerase-3 subunit beta
MNTINVNPMYLKALLLVAGNKDIRYYLNGVCVEIHARYTRYVATDGHRLALIHDAVPADDEDQSPAVMIIPRDAIKAVKAIKGRNAVPMSYDAVNPSAECRIEGATPVVFQPIDGKFPDYSRVIPQTTNGEPGAYDWQYMADFDSLTEIAFGCRYSVALHQNGPSSSALVTVPNHAFLGVIMPLRNNEPSEPAVLPEWYSPAMKVAA